jgi:hydroxyacylglutathione hydrolase
MNNLSSRISALPAFSDNYIWLIRGTGRTCAVVDPGDHRPVMQILDQQDLDLRYILITHHHADHIGGVKGLLRKFPAEVYAPADTRIRHPGRVVKEGDRVSLAGLGIEFTVIEVPGHTRSHIAYHGEGVLFCGDTLFSIGCGRLFEGSPEQMQESLDKLAALPTETQVYCAHEYTQSNCAFALEVEPRNPVLLARAAQVRDARSRGAMTIPSSLGEELAANPFMRTRQEPVVQAARNIEPQARPGAETMAVIRAWKDRF